MKRSLIFIPMLLISTQAAALPARTPEEEAAWLVKVLRPIPDEDWRSIAGPKATENYQIVSGDTLYDISKRLFGDAKYWPKIWALNNGAITNPHYILPGNAVAFLPGSGTSLPSVAINQVSTELPSSTAGSVVASGQTTTTSDDRSALRGVSPASITPDSPRPPLDAYGRAQEWRLLGGKQTWEYSTSQLPKAIDSVGLDKRSRISFKFASGYELDSFAATDEWEPLGEIYGARTPASYFGLSDIVFIELEDDSKPLQIGEVYTITSDKPDYLKHSNADREILSYLNLGRIRAIGVKDGKFVGEILAVRGTIPRGSKIVPLQPRAELVPPIAGPSALEATLLVNKRFTTYLFGQYKQVFLDRGTEDGIKPGMVFRVYQHEDLNTGKDLTDSDFVISADIEIVQVSERTCTGLVLRSLYPIEEGETAVLLTDVNDLMYRRVIREKAFERGSKVKDTELDNLDDLDVSGGLGNKEADELKQLEDFNEGDPASSEAPPADPGLDDSAAAPPPPPAEQDPSTAPLPESLESSNEELPPPDPAGPPPETEGDSAPATEGNEPSAEASPVPPPEELPPPPEPEPATGKKKKKKAESEDLDNLLNQ